MERVPLDLGLSETFKMQSEGMELQDCTLFKTFS